MFGNIGTTWTLMGASFDVLKKDKELLLFPLISGISCLLVSASFIYPALPYLESMGEAVDSEQANQTREMLQYAYLFLFYLANYFVIFFFNTAVVACAALRFEGHDPTLGDGMRASFSRLPQIFGWSVLSATVGMILRIIEDKSEKVGALVAGLLGMAWTLVSFLAVPVLVLEKKGPFGALKESTSLLKQTWGQQLMGNFSFGLVFFLLNLPGIAGIIAGVVLMSGGTAVLGGLLLGVSVLYMILVSLVQSVLQVIFQTALYMYARNGHAPEGFSEQLLGQAVGSR